MSNSQPGLAVCEIDNCGVLAIGRCATCSRAFCASHQAQGFHLTAFAEYTPLADMCAQCYAQTPDEIKRVTEKQQIEEVNATLSWLQNGGAEAALRQAGIPTVAIYETKREYKSGFFRDHTVQTYVPLGQGWIVGTFPAQFSTTRNGEFTHERIDYLAAVMPSGTGKPISMLNRPIPVGNRIEEGPAAGGHATPFMQGYSDGKFQGSVCYQIAQAIKKLVGEPSGTPYEDLLWGAQLALH